MAPPVTSSSFMFGCPALSTTPRSQPPEARASAAGTKAVHTLADVDTWYESQGCLGRGGFGCVFLAKKRSASHRKVALKVVRLDEEGENFKTFTREIEAVMALNSESTKKCGDGSHDNGAQGIVFIEDWFIGLNFACIIMNYADGGTLRDEIDYKKAALANGDVELYSERRMAWYALQLSEALAFAHGRGVFHHDVKSANILIDHTMGGKLLLADFGSAVAIGEHPVALTMSYAPPELLQVFRADSSAAEHPQQLQADRIDAFGLGCILFELLACSKLEDLLPHSDDENGLDRRTLADIIVGWGLEVTLNNHTCMKLSWLPPTDENVPLTAQIVGYSHALKCLVKNMLNPDPSARWSPSQLQENLRKDLYSPLLEPIVIAARPLCPGYAVTIDNIQLGALVVRGPDWTDGDDDGGMGSIGCVVQLDADAGYTWVAFPCARGGAEVEKICYRIGFMNKFELRTAPERLSDEYLTWTDVPRWKCSGLSSTRKLIPGMAACASVGQRPHPGCQIVGADISRDMIMVAPTEKLSPYLMASIAFSTPPSRCDNRFRCAGPREPLPLPRSWVNNLYGLDLASDSSDTRLLEVPTASDEYNQVKEKFHGGYGGLDPEQYEITTVRRVHNAALYKIFARKREQIALENWGVDNTETLFHGFPITHVYDGPEARCLTADFYDNLVSMTDATRRFDSDLRDGEVPRFRFARFYSGIMTSASASCAHQRPYCNNSGEYQVMLAKITLGRVRPPVSPLSHFGLRYHSWMEVEAGVVRYEPEEPSQLYPEHLITYRVRAPRFNTGDNRRVIRALRPVIRYDEMPSSPSPPPSSEEQISPSVAGVAVARVESPATSSIAGFRDAVALRTAGRGFRDGWAITQCDDGAAAVTAAAIADGKLSSVKIKKSATSVTNHSPTTIKECVICMERPVSIILLPCGHPCLCKKCCTDETLTSIRRKCPECRTVVKMTANFYGKVLMDD